MGVFRWRKRKNKSQLISCGLYMEQPAGSRQGSSLAQCLIRSVLVFFVVYGSIGGFLSAFHMEYSALLSAICLLLCALYFGYLFSFQKKIWKDIGYILFFILYVIGIFYLRTYANSGFAAIINSVRARGEFFFDLEAGMPFREIIENPFITITVIFVFLGMFEIIVLNIFVSGYMSLKIPVLAAFSMYAIPLYFRAEPELPYVLCMFFGLMGIYVFKNNGKRVYIPALIVVSALVAVLGIGTFFFSQADWERHYVENEYKTATREGVSGFISLGFLMFFQNSYSKGGMNGGQLGNISAIRPTGEVHLRVRYTPYDRSPLYLKAFTGFTYHTNAWNNRLTEEEKARYGVSPGIYEELLVEQMQQMEKGYKKKKNGARGIMKITNVAASETYYYLPYLSETPEALWNNKEEEKLFFAKGTGISVPYYPMIFPVERTQVLPSDYAVPAENYLAVSQACRDAGLRYGQEDAVRRVEEYLESEYSYSYNPGRTPDGEDVVNYFLEKNKKGICAHFASAATLMLRYLGYPARYVEGYAAGYGSLSGGTRTEEPFENYYDGSLPIGKSAVMEIEITDADAHAWVEVYEKGTGWYILDPTPASVDVGSDENFWRTFLEMLPDSQEEGTDGGATLNFLRGTGRPLGVVLGIVCLILPLCWLVWKYVRFYRRLHSGDRRANILFAYRERCRRLEKKDAEFARLSTPAERIPYLMEFGRAGPAGGYSAEELTEKFEAVCFSKEQPIEEDYNILWNFLRKGRRK